jgi:hypothetical protein
MTSKITLMPVLSQIPEKKFQDSINLCREVADTNDIKPGMARPRRFVL